MGMAKLSEEELAAKRAAFEADPEMFFDVRHVSLMVDKMEVEPGKIAYMVVDNFHSIQDVMMVQGHVNERCDLVRAEIRINQMKKQKGSILTPGSGGFKLPTKGAFGGNRLKL